MKIYLDTCILSRLLQNDIQDKQLTALELLSERKDVSFVTSPKTLEEFTNTRDDRKRRTLKVFFKLIEKVYAPPHTYGYSGLIGDTPIGVAPLGGGGGTVIEPIYQRVLEIFGDPNDSEHIYIARKAECDYFMTLDFKTILNKIKENRIALEGAISPMQIIDPASLAQGLV